jgi:hypothetical protein
VTREPQTPPTRDEIGLGWQHVFHARACMHSLDADELCRALAAATEALLAEVREHDAELAKRLEPLLRSAT